MDKYQLDFLDKAARAAEEAGHIYPSMAACEAALESRYGNSALAIQDNNLFGMKQHVHPVYGTASFPTREYINGVWITVSANFVKYPGWRECFIDRMSTLTRLANSHPHYKNAIKAPDGGTFVKEVSLTWSTDPDRAKKVLDIYRLYLGG